VSIKTLAKVCTQINTVLERFEGANAPILSLGEL
jgi:hypothetical protein